MNRHGVALASVALFVGCSGKSNLEPPAPLVDFSPTVSVKRLWKADVGRGEEKKLVRLSPVLHGGVIYVADPNGRVRAYAADSGRRIWTVHTDDPVGGGVGFGEGLVLVGTKRARVIALRPDTGEIVWGSRVSSEVLAPPAAGSGVVVVQTIDGKLVGLSADDGKQLWLQQRSGPPLSLRGTSTPVISTGLVLSGFASGKIVAFNLENGRPVWEQSVAHPQGRSEIERLVDVDAAPLVVGNIVFAASYQGKIVAMEMETGRVIWSRDVSTYTGMDADRENIFLTDEGGNVLALDQRSGASLWKQGKLRARALNAPTLITDYVAVGDLAGYVHWLSKEDGQFVARFRIGNSPIRGRTVAADDTLFVQNQRGVLAALRIQPSAVREP